MPRVIHRCTLAILDTQVLPLHEGWTLVHFGVQNGLATMWIAADTSRRSLEYTFTKVATGDQVPGRHDYVGTAVLPPYVWHFFVRK